MNKTSKHKVWIGLGTNLGHRIQNLENALKAMEDYGCSIKAVSHIYESEPWGFESKHTFFNQSIVVETNHSAVELLKILKEIEMNSGRKYKKGEYIDRIIDLDILFYEDKVIQSDSLIIPHPLLHERLFVLYPLAEISPGKKHPVSGKTVSELLNDCIDPCSIRQLSIK